MSKAAKKYGEDAISVPVASILPSSQKDGWMWKQGGSIKSWKRRYFILKGATIYYYKAQKDSEITGRIDLEPRSTVTSDASIKKTAYGFCVRTEKRIYPIVAEKNEDMVSWIKAIEESISSLKRGGGSTDERHISKPQSNAGGSYAPNPTQNTFSGPLTIRNRLNAAKSTIPFLCDADNKVVEFWSIWVDSIPTKAELLPEGAIEFSLSVSLDMQKLTWRTCGPQNVFIQKMVDFFWNVGAPESEIDRLNTVGEAINPGKIGSWIDMSAKGGMDGGWYFPVDVVVKTAATAADPFGDAIQKFTDWIERKEIKVVNSIGRDMGAAPPRQTEFKFRLPGSVFESQLELALDAFNAFGFPPMETQHLVALRDFRPNGLILSVVTCAEGFVRLGLLCPNPPPEMVNQLDHQRTNRGDVIALQSALGVNGPSFVEFQYLMKPFGYGVYKEGYDIAFHYFIGTESFES